MPNEGRDTALDYDPFAPADWRAPYPAYRRLRDADGIHFSESAGVYCVSRYDDVVAVLRDAETFSSQGAFEVLIKGRTVGLLDVFEILRFLVRARINPLGLRQGAFESLITVDPPRHDALRSLVNRGFTPRRLQGWDKRIGELAAECVSPLERSGRFDVVADLAIPLPVTLITEMLGIEPERRADFKRWSDELVAGVSGSQRNAPFRGFLRSMGELMAYLRPQIERRRAQPGSDLISVLVDPTVEPPLSDDAVQQFVLLLLVAGNETTTNLIGNSVGALLRRPDLLARVREDPERIPDLIEESLRFESPVQMIFRKTTREVMLAGTHIPAGGTLALLLGAANRDERQFESPDRFDLERGTRGHLAFGLGVHFCLGASLARLEAQQALTALLPRLDGVRAREHETAYIDSVLVRGPQSLELVAA